MTQTSMGAAEIIYLEEPPKGNLKLFDLYTIALGGAVGAGVVSFTGQAIGLTGMSMWLAYIIGILWGAIVVLPYFIIGSTLRLGGGEYSTIGALLSERYAGMYIIGKIIYPFYFGTYGVSFASYFCSVITGANIRLVGVLFIVVFFVVNYFGAKMSSRTQNVMFVVLIAGLLAFIICGIPKISNPIFHFSGNPDMFTHGAGGFMNAVVLLGTSCQAYYTATQFGRYANNAQKDIPKAMLLCIPTLIVLYGGCGIVASGVLPISETAFQPLTITARQIMPDWLFVLFIAAVAMAIATTLNSLMGGTLNTLTQSVDNGWLPKIAGKKNKYGTAVYILIFECICAAIPVATGFDITTITRYVNLFNPVLGMIFTVSLFQLPKRYPNAWAKSSLHMPIGLLYTLLTLSLGVQTYIVYNSATTLPFNIVIVTVTLFILLMIYAIWKSKKNVRAEISVWE